MMDRVRVWLHPHNSTTLLGSDSLTAALLGATPIDQTTLPEGAEQISLMSQNMSGELSIYGYWNWLVGLPEDDVLDWFESDMEETGLSDLKDTLYCPQTADAEFGEMLRQVTCSVMVQPVLSCWL